MHSSSWASTYTDEKQNKIQNNASERISLPGWLYSIATHGPFQLFEV